MYVNLREPMLEFAPTGFGDGEWLVFPFNLFYFIIFIIIILWL